MIIGIYGICSETVVKRMTMEEYDTILFQLLYKIKFLVSSSTHPLLLGINMEIVYYLNPLTFELVYKKDISTML